MGILPNIKAQIFDPSFITKLKNMGLNISHDESCYFCGLEFEPKDLKRFIDIKFVQQNIIESRL
jgi:hypothetical protein